MKRKFISLLCSLLSIIAAIVYVMIAVVLLSRVIGAKEYIPTVDNDIWIIKVLTRLKDAGFNLFFSVMGIVLASVLALYRLALAYFYNKVSKTDDTFYKARLGEIVFFTFFAGLAIVAIAWFCFSVKGVLPAEIQPFLLVQFFIYILLCILPIVEVVLVYTAKVIRSKPIKSVPTKDGVVSELDELADLTALAVVYKQEEKKEQEPAPIPATTKPTSAPATINSVSTPATALASTPAIVKPIVKEVIVPRVRKVVDYVTPYWDKQEASCDEIEKADCTKFGIRKKNRKPSYNSAKLRITKPMSHKKRLKIMSPAKMSLRYKKAVKLTGDFNEKRK